MGIVGNQTHFVFESYVIGWVLQPDQVSSKSERELVSRLPALMDTVLRAGKKGFFLILGYSRSLAPGYNHWQFRQRRLILY